MGLLGAGVSTGSSLPGGVQVGVGRASRVIAGNNQQYAKQISCIQEEFGKDFKVQTN